MAYGLGLTVQVTERGQIFTSEDLVFWEPWNSGTTNTLLGVAFFGQRLVVTGGYGTVLYADSLESFQSGTLPAATSNWLTDVAATSSLVVTVGDNAAIYSSSDGATWSKENAPSGSTNWLRSVTSDNQNTFVAVGEFGFIATRANNGTWTKRTSGTTNHLNKVAYINGLYWAVGENGTVLNGTQQGNNWNWTAVANTGATGTLYSVTGTTNTTLLVGDGELRLSENGGAWLDQLSSTKPAPATSWTYYTGVYEDTFYLIAGHSGMIFEGFKTNATDTIWVTRHQPYRNWLWDMTALPDFYCAVGDKATILTSENGVGWNLESVPDAATSSIFLGVGGSTNGLVVAGSHGTILYSANIIANAVFTNPDQTSITNSLSTVGTFWTMATSPTTNDLQGVAVSTNLYLISGGTGTILTSGDGVIWGLQTTPTTKYLSSVVSFPGGYVATGDGGTILSSSNGTNWTVRTSGISNWIYRVRYLNSQLIAVGENGTILVSNDGVNWTPRNSGTTKWLNDVAYLGNTYFAFGNQGTVLASANTTTWLNIGTITEKSLYAAASRNGQLVAAGVEGAIVRTPLIPNYAPAYFVSLGRTNSQNLILLSGQPDQRFMLQQSTNLTSWLDSVNLEILDDSGTILFLDAPDTTTNAMEFYRTLMLQ